MTPTLDPITDPTVLEDAAPADGQPRRHRRGPANESQTLTVTATSSNPALIPNPTVTYTSPNATGSLTYTPVANQRHGHDHRDRQDNGGTANGGVDTTSRPSPSRSTPVNDGRHARRRSPIPTASSRTPAADGQPDRHHRRRGDESQTLTVTATLEQHRR